MAATGRKRTRDRRQVLLDNAKGRAVRFGLPFSLSLHDIVIPDRCPVLGIPLSHGIGKRGKHAGSPTLDRLVPEFGYVPGNVLVVSSLANEIKSDATPDQIRRVADFYDRHLRTQETMT